MLVSRKQIFVFFTGLIAAMVIAGGLSFPLLERQFMREQAARDQVPLRLAAEGLQAAISRYAPLPALIAERAQLVDALANPDNADLIASVNEGLRQTGETVRASDVFLMDVAGRTIAAASYRQQDGLLGQNLSYRTYFQQALNGDLSSFSVYGTTTGERGYFYAAPVEDGERIVGVLAVKFSIAAFESVWRGADSEIMVSDRNDFVFMSSRADWHFRVIRPFSEKTRRVIAQNLQYPIDRIELLPITSFPLGDAADHVFIEGDTRESYVLTSLHLPAQDWTIASLSPTSTATVAALRALLIAGLSGLLVLAGLLAYLLKQARQAEMLAREQDAKRALEVAVADRTATLRQALADLQQSQTDVIQAGKLSALGQMSAALSHEFNQPLAAVKSYADNADAFLDRKNLPEAQENIRRISRMVDRMATISTHLRNFARRPQQETGPLSLEKVIQDAILVTEVHVKSQGGRIAYTPPAHPVWVTGGHVRLQQVIVNLINNALDAMSGQPDPVVEIQMDGTAVIVRDTGPGVPSDICENIFDPFFTTKSPGKGLGLGLSISYNIVTDFGGTLTVGNHPDGGAVFTLTLQSATPTEVAAQ